MLPEGINAAGMVWIAVCIFLLAMGKGGFPVGGVALPLLILVWPGQAETARTAVAFMLPVLCLTDVVALAFYRRHVLWRRLLPLWPGTVAGIAVAGALFVSKESALVAVSDRVLKLLIGVLGLSFVFYRLARAWVIKRLGTLKPGWGTGTVFGLAAGITSTLAHAAGPVMQMYLLPQNLAKMNLAATTAAFFFVVNLLKLVPFGLLGRIQPGNLALAARLVPVIPVGVACGYLLVRLMKGRHYVVFIHAILFVTSLTLVWKAVSDA